MGIQLWNSIRATDFVMFASRRRSRTDCGHRRIGRRHADVFPDGGGRTHQGRRSGEHDLGDVAGRRLRGRSQPACGWTDFSNMVVGALMAPRPLLLVSNRRGLDGRNAQGSVSRRSRAFTGCSARKTSRERSLPAVHPQLQQGEPRSGLQVLQRDDDEQSGARDGADFRVDFPHDLLALFGRQRPANAMNGPGAASWSIRFATARDHDRAAAAARRRRFRCRHVMRSPSSSAVFDTRGAAQAG